MRRPTPMMAAFRRAHQPDALMARIALARAGEGRAPDMAASRSGYNTHIPLHSMKYITLFSSYIPRSMLIRGMVIGVLLILLGLFGLLS